MNLMYTIVLIFCAIQATKLKANNTQALAIPMQKRIVVISTPKGGGHLLAKVIELLTHKKAIYNQTCMDVDNTAYNTNFAYLPDNTFACTHIFYTEKNISAVKNNCVFFITRDPRDAAVSFAHLVKESSTWSKIVNFKVPLSELIDRFAYDFSIQAPGWKHIPSGSADIFFSNYFGWKKEKNVCFIRFEDIVGKEYGGDVVKQTRAILDIAKHINISVNQSDIESIIQHLNLPIQKTVHQIGCWKKYFTLEHKNIYKIHLKRTLQYFGYEDHSHW